MFEPEDILMTGGEGRLGTELRGLLAGIKAPTESAMDITDRAAVAAVLDAEKPAALLHCAAYTDVKGAETDRGRCWAINVGGTRHLVAEAMARGIFFIHMSTDYVFYGDTGGYREDDPVGPVRNYYALSKLAAEQLVRLCERHLVIRTSFRPRQWPYPTAFTDVYTSQDYVDVIAPMIARAVARAEGIPYDTLHIATRRKSVYDLAVSRKPDVTAAGKAAAGVDLPDDISLDVSRWQALQAQWNRP